MDKKIKRLNGLIATIVDSKEECVPLGIGYKDISKISCDRYASQKLVRIKVFFYSKGSLRNNKPYSMIDLVPIEVYNTITNDLFDVLTDNSIEYSFVDNAIDRKEEIHIDPDLISEESYDDY